MANTMSGSSTTLEGLKIAVPVKVRSITVKVVKIIFVSSQYDVINVDM